MKLTRVIERFPHEQWYREVGALISVLNSTGSEFKVPLIVLDSDGNEFSVPRVVLDSDGNGHTVV